MPRSDCSALHGANPNLKKKKSTVNPTDGKKQKIQRSSNMMAIRLAFSRLKVVEMISQLAILLQGYIRPVL